MRLATMKTQDLTLPDLLPSLEALSRVDKLRAIQYLATDLAKEEGEMPFFQSGVPCPVWTPLEAYDAAAALMKMLETERNTP
jgi:hypothetical protein